MLPIWVIATVAFLCGYGFAIFLALIAMGEGAVRFHVTDGLPEANELPPTNNVSQLRRGKTARPVQHMRPSRMD